MTPGSKQRFAHLGRDPRLRLILASAWTAGAFALTASLLLPPLATFEPVNGHDSSLHFVRLIYAYEAVREGLWDWSWLPGMGRGFGYPIFHYYPPGATWLALVFRWLTGDFGAALNLLCGTALALGWVGMWLLADRERRGISSDRWSPVPAAAALLYVTAPYVLLNVFVRAALPEALALGLAPWVVWLCSEAMRDRANRVGWILAGAVSWTALLLTHNLSAMWVGALVLALCLRDAIQAEREGQASRWRSGLGGMTALVVGAGLSAFHWLPSFAAVGAVRGHDVLEGPANFRDHFVYPLQLFEREWGFGVSVPGPGDGMSFQVGWVHVGLLLAAAWILVARRRRKDASATNAAWRARRGRVIGFWLPAGAVAIILMLAPSRFIWEWIVPLQYLGFPWRLLGPVVLASSVLAVPILAGPSLGRELVGSTLIVIAAIGLYAPLSTARYLTVPMKPPTNVASLQRTQGHLLTTSTAWNEFLPIDVKTYPDLPPVAQVLVPEGVRVIAFERRPREIRFRVISDRPVTVAVSQFRFPGWKVSIDGRRARIVSVGPYGLIGTEVPAGRADVRVWFGLTTWRTLGALVTLLAALTAMVWTVRA